MMQASLQSATQQRGCSRPFIPILPQRTAPPPRSPPSDPTQERWKINPRFSRENQHLQEGHFPAADTALRKRRPENGRQRGGAGPRPAHRFGPNVCTFNGRWGRGECPGETDIQKTSSKHHRPFRVGAQTHANWGPLGFPLIQRAGWKSRLTT